MIDGLMARPLDPLLRVCTRTCVYVCFSVRPLIRVGAVCECACIHLSTLSRFSAGVCVHLAVPRPQTPWLPSFMEAARLHRSDTEASARCACVSGNIRVSCVQVPTAHIHATPHKHTATAHTDNHPHSPTHVSQGPTTDRRERAEKHENQQATSPSQHATTITRLPKPAVGLAWRDVCCAYQQKPVLQVS